MRPNKHHGGTGQDIWKCALETHFFTSFATKATRRRTGCHNYLSVFVLIGSSPQSNFGDVHSDEMIKSQRPDLSFRRQPAPFGEPKFVYTYKLKKTNFKLKMHKKRKKFLFAHFGTEIRFFSVVIFLQMF